LNNKRSKMNVYIHLPRYLIRLNFCVTENLETYSAEVISLSCNAPETGTYRKQI